MILLNGKRALNLQIVAEMFGGGGETVNMVAKQYELILSRAADGTAGQVGFAKFSQSVFCAC